MASGRVGTLSKGLFSTGTRSTTINASKIFEEGIPVFCPEPSGPYGEASACERVGAQEHYVGREITLRNPGGMPLPCSSYRDHYIGSSKEPEEDLGADFNNGHVPFTSRSEYQKEFSEKQCEPFCDRVIDSKAGTVRDTPPRIQGTTTHGDSFKPFTVTPDVPKTAVKNTPRRIDIGSFMKDSFSSTYTQMHSPKPVPPKECLQNTAIRPPMPMLNTSTTYGTEFPTKDPLEFPISEVEFDKTPSKFDDRTTYKREFSPKECRCDLPHLTGVKDPDTIQLSLPRRSLGVQYVTPGASSDLFFNMIPRHMEAPCTGSHVFTTTHDNQEQACILVVYGDKAKASENTVLGQFDILKILPAPKGAPRIEVTFHLDKNLCLNVAARDLDSRRQVQWAQRGEIIVRNPDGDED